MIVPGERVGEIVTFYSYKGGVGRTMALSNVAWLLASNGKRVLIMDWDLEAPGLPPYFGPFLDQKSLASSPGLMDWFIAQREALHPGSGLPRFGGSATQDAGDMLLESAVEIRWSFPDGGGLDLVSSGSAGPSYAEKVTNFDWKDFYERHDGYKIVDRLRNTLRGAYDYVLIDSRTGVSDTGGICTMQMPDVVVICTSLNHQSLGGAANIAHQIDAHRPADRGAAIRIFPVKTRVELAEKQRLELAREEVMRRFGRFLWHLPEDARMGYWATAEIPYFANYSYEEILCAFDEEASSPFSMSASIERFTSYITGNKVGALPPLDPKARAIISAAFARHPADPGAASCFLSYSSKDEAFAKKLHADLDRAGVKCWFAPHDLPIGAKIRRGIDEAIKGHDKVILVLSANSLASTWVEKEVETAFELEAMTAKMILVPLRLDDEVLTTNAAWAADIRRQRNIGDFKRWDDKTSYGLALNRLLDSLNAY